MEKLKISETVRSLNPETSNASSNAQDGRKYAQDSELIALFPIFQPSIEYITKAKALQKWHHPQTKLVAMTRKGKVRKYRLKRVTKKILNMDLRHNLTSKDNNKSPSYEQGLPISLASNAL